MPVQLVEILSTNCQAIGERRPGSALDRCSMVGNRKTEKPQEFYITFETTYITKDFI